MSKPRVIYRIYFDNEEKLSDQETANAQTIYADMYDNGDLIDDGYDQGFELLDAGDVPIQLSVIDDDEDKFTPIRSLQAVLQLYSNERINMATFASMKDPCCDIYVNDSNRKIFCGRMLFDENSVSEEFLPHPRQIEITANDGLGLLKEIPLVKSDGNNPTGYNNIISYLAWCLGQTGRSLPINVIFNIKEQSSYFSASLSFVAATKTINYPSVYDSFFASVSKIIIYGSQRNDNTLTIASRGTGSITVNESIHDEINLSSARINVADADWHFFKDIYLDAKTFEEQIGTCISCYEVIQRILGEEAVLFQDRGQWFILRIDEVEDGRGYYVSSFDSDGTFLQNGALTDFNKTIKKDGYVICFSQEETKVTLQVPYKSVKETFNYELPFEIPCNVDFSRGDAHPSLDGTFDDDGDGTADSYKAFDVECWTMRKGVPGNYGTADSVAYIRRFYNNVDYEKSRYLVLKPSSSFESNTISDVQYLESQAIRVEEKAKFTFSYDVRTAANFTGSQIRRLGRVVLDGDDGNWYVLDFETWQDDTTPPKWYDTSGWTINSAFGMRTYTASLITETDWNNLSIDAPPVPVSGNVYLWLNQFNQLNDSSDNIDIFYQNVQFTYYPFINGSYQKYTGQYHQVTQATNPNYYRPKRDNQVYISDSPAKLFKGALFIYNGSDYVLAGLFYNGAVFPYGPPSTDYLHPYGEIQIWDVWNQFRNMVRVFQATAQGLDSGSQDGFSRCDMISLLHKIILADPTENTSGKYFLAITFKKDMKLCEWTGTLKEVYDIPTGKHYDDTHEFKYIT